MRLEDPRAVSRILDIRQSNEGDVVQANSLQESYEAVRASTYRRTLRQLQAAKMDGAAGTLSGSIYVEDDEDVTVTVENASSPRLAAGILEGQLDAVAEIFEGQDIDSLAPTVALDQFPSGLAPQPIVEFATELIWIATGRTNDGRSAEKVIRAWLRQEGEPTATLLLSGALMVLAALTLWALPTSDHD